MNGYTFGASTALLLFFYLLVIDYVSLYPLNDLARRGMVDLRRLLLIRYIPPILTGTLLLFEPSAIAAWCAIFVAFLYATVHFLVWWKPYLFGSSEPYKRKMLTAFGRTHRFLPGVKDHLVPDTAHVVAGLLSVLLLVFSIVAASGQTRSVDKPIQAEKAVPKPAAEFAFTQAGQHPEKLLLELIASAKKTLDIAVSSLSHEEIVKAIADAKGRGVAVRLITDRTETAGSSQQSEKIKSLIEAQIPVKENTYKGLMNLKLTIADGTTAAAGSFNYTINAATNNDELLLELHDPVLAQSLSQQFETMWNDNKNYRELKLGVVPKK